MRKLRIVELLQQELFKIISGKVVRIGFAVLLILNIMTFAYFSARVQKNLIVTQDDYTRRLDSVILNTDKNMLRLKALGIDEDQYVYRYQQHVKGVYSKLAPKVRLAESPVSSGWKLLVDYDFVCAFSFLFAVLMISQSFIEERWLGIWLVVRTGRNGRLVTAFCKMGVFSALTFLTTVTFQLSQLIMIGFTFGYDGFFECVQNIDGYILYPYNELICGFILKVFLGRAAVIVLLSYVVVCLSTVSNNVYISAIGAIVCYALGFILDMVSGTNEWLKCNFYSVISPSTIYERVHTVNFFGQTANSALMTWMFIIVAGIVCMAVSLYKLSVGYVNHKIANRIKRRSVVNVKYKFTRDCQPSVSLTTYEIHKLATPATLIIMITLMVLKLCSTNISYDVEIARKYEIVKELIDEHVGESIEKMLENFELELTEFNKIVELEGDMTDRYFQGEITSAEFTDYIDSKNIAVAKIEPLSILISRLSYLANLDLDKGLHGELLFDYAAEKLCKCDFDLPLFLTVVLISITVALYERASGSNGCFLPILSTTKYGRKNALDTKAIMLTSVTIGVCCVYALIELGFFLYYGDVSSLNVPIVSLPTYCDTDSSISILLFFVLRHFLNTIAYIAVALVILTVSQYFRNRTVMYLITTTVIAFPTALRRSGAGIFEYFDPTLLMSGNRIYLLSSRVIQMDFLIWTLVVMAFALVSVVIYFLCRCDDRTYRQG